MPRPTQSKTREIIDDFAKEIQKKSRSGVTPDETIIDFRNERRDNVSRQVCVVPIELLRYRKDNGRISSDVETYRKKIGRLNEKDSKTQEILEDFLNAKDPEKTRILKNQIEHNGQLDPAIITCDGFLINGNRRRLVIGQLHKELGRSSDYESMKVIILPGKEEEGGPPTRKEIEQIENRYQLQSEGKSEYSNFDRAISIRRKIRNGFDLKEQLKDDPEYANASEKEFNAALNQYKKNYLDPLECIDRYLNQFDRAGIYDTISKGPHDREGRWQAFLDYSKQLSQLKSDKFRMNSHIEEDEIGEIEEAAFNMIRLRDLNDMPKVHSIMRDLPKLCATKEGKKEIFAIARKVSPELSSEELTGVEDDLKGIDQKWATNHRPTIVRHAKKAYEFHNNSKERATPLTLLDQAYKKLIHDDMTLEAIPSGKDHDSAMQLARDIQQEAKNIEKTLYRQAKDFRKKTKQLEAKYSKKK